MRTAGRGCEEEPVRGERAAGGVPPYVSEQLQKWRAATQLAGRAGATVALFPPASGGQRTVHSNLSE